MKAFLGVDIGTSSTKGVLVDTAGRILATAIRPHQVDQPAQGHFEMAPAIWWDEFISICNELTSLIPALVIGLGVSGMGPCAVITDPVGEPTRPAILYGIDTRATRQISDLTVEMGSDEILQRTGNMLTSQSVGPKLRWIAEHDRPSLKRARRLFMPSSWIIHRLTGEYLMDYHSASQCTPLFDIRTDSWSQDWAAEIAPWLELPHLAWSGDIIGETTTTIGGIPAGTPVIAGTIDAWAEAVSVGADSPSELMIMYGTTMFMIANTPHQPSSDRLWVTRGISTDGYSLAGGISTAGSLTKWTRDLTGDIPFEQLANEAKASGPGARGLLMLPYFAGERTPILDPNAKGIIAGLTLNHTRGDIYRAALEGIALAVRNNLHAMRDAGITLTHLTAVGGGASSSLWVQTVSDATQLPQAIPTQTVGASFGMTMLVARALGVNSRAQLWNPTTRIVHPNQTLAPLYEERFALFSQLYTASADAMHALRA